MVNRYKEVVILNEELLTGCHIRRATQEQAVASLKSLHTILQQAARLRGENILVTTRQLFFLLFCTNDLFKHLLKKTTKSVVT